MVQSKGRPIEAKSACWSLRRRRRQRGSLALHVMPAFAFAPTLYSLALTHLTGLALPFPFAEPEGAKGVAARPARQAALLEEGDSMNAWPSAAGSCCHPIMLAASSHQLAGLRANSVEKERAGMAADWLCQDTPLLLTPTSSSPPLPDPPVTPGSAATLN